MSIGILTMLTPLEDRIDRWATSGNATRILLHPEDFLRLNEVKREKLTAKYNLPVEALGGKRALNEYLRLTEENDKEEMQTILADLNDVFQSEE